jgi:2,4-didehydro-3-deoxy-L-rhamnonate hydrolase
VAARGINGADNRHHEIDLPHTRRNRESKGPTTNEGKVIVDHAGPFALGTFSTSRSDSTQSTEPFPGLVLHNTVLDLRATAERLGLSGRFTVLDILNDWDRLFPELRAIANENEGALPTSDSLLPLDQLTIHAPVQPRQVLQSGANYHKHVIDLAVAHLDIAAGRTPEQVRSETKALMEARAKDGVPYIFIGLPAAVSGPNDDLTLPAYSKKVDWELELAAVIGRRAYRVSKDDALDYVAGYTIVNDITTRELVFRQDMKEVGSDWFRSKNAPGFLPTGPYIVPADFVGDLSELTITLELNGKVMQDESTSDMIFDVPSIISAASQIIPLLPGDLILTGSPAGNGMHWGRLLQDGDVMDGRITGLGAQRTKSVAEAQS